MSLEKFPKFLLNFSEVEMKGNGEKHFYQFKSFRLNVEERQLLQNESVVSLTPKAFDLLALLVEQNGHLVEKDELLRTVWADSFVEEANIPRIIHTLRKTLGEDEKENKFIETVAKKGYRFVAEVTETPSGDAAPLREKDAETDKKTDAAVEEKSPRPRVAASPRLILFAVGFLTAAFLLVLLSFNLQSDSAMKPGEMKSIAVLPLKPIGAGVRDEIYELGIAESLITNLGLLKGFVVRPLSATRKYSNIEQDPLAAGKEQKTNYVLAANYQIADGKIRITAQLYNVNSGQIEDTYKSEKEAGNIFALQDAVAADIGNLLQKRFAITSNNTKAKRGTTNEEAYRLYLQGKNLTMQRSLEGARKAIECLEQAIRLDPNYALAYAGLANAHHAMATQGYSRADGEKGKEAVRKALDLDPNLAEAYAARGRIDFAVDWDFAAAERDLLRAIELDPNNDGAHWGYALVSAYTGRFDQALAEIETAQAIDPGALLYMRDRGRVLYYARRYDEAIAELKRVIDLDANFVTAYNWLVHAYEMKGDYAGAYETFIKSPRGRKYPEIYQKVYETEGWAGIQRKKLEFFQLEQDDNFFNVAEEYAVLGEKERAFEYLNKAVEKHEWALVMINVDPALDPLRDDPRFSELLMRIGFEKKLQLR